MMSTSPRFHAPPHVLMEYAAGTATGPTSLVVACHLTFCPACRKDVTLLEEVGAGLLDEQPSVAMAPGAFELAMAALDSEPTPTPAAPSSGASNARLPRPLLEVLADGKLKLRRRLPGLRTKQLKLGHGLAEARLMLFQPGTRIPFHDHDAPELVLVLEGALEEGGRHFARGDIAFSDSGERHEQRIANQGPCLALVVNEGPVRPVSVWGKLLKRLAGL